MKTAARVQVPYNPEVPQYVEGHEDFNVWYGKYLSDRRNPRDKDRYSAGHTCDPEKDSGWTQADLPGSGSPGFLLILRAWLLRLRTQVSQLGGSFLHVSVQ